VPGLSRIGRSEVRDGDEEFRPSLRSACWTTCSVRRQPSPCPPNPASLRLKPNGVTAGVDAQSCDGARLL
jgi:hypothetical protein